MTKAPDRSGVERDSVAQSQPCGLEAAPRSSGLDAEPSALFERLRKRYTPDPVPPCRVCGKALQISRAGGGSATEYACPEASLKEPDHYDRSRFIHYRPGDADVLAPLDAERSDPLRETVQSNPSLGSGGEWRWVPVEPTREMWAKAGDAVVMLQARMIGNHDTISGAVWSAMIAAAPPPVPTIPGGGEGDQGVSVSVARVDVTQEGASDSQEGH